MIVKPQYALILKSTFNIKVSVVCVEQNLFY